MIFILKDFEMCGIAGELIYEDSMYSSDDSIKNVSWANQQQFTRGPDQSGLFQAGNITFGHRRLKIFDLSNLADQPMVDHELGLMIVFNGAIYNFHALRKKLITKGYKFISDGDTEVLLKAYHAWGKKCLQHLNGMFAFAIWERESGQLILARDRHGIKPLYYSSNKNAFRFASTLPALLKFNEVDTAIDPIGLHHYLNFHAVPEPHTIIAGIKKVTPGCLLSVSPNGKIEQENYWELKINEANTDNIRDEKAWLIATNDVLTQAVRSQLQTDTSAGILLSGGLDSSLITALAAKFNRQISTFSIGFEGLPDCPGDEFYYSNLVANHFKTNHHRLFISNHQLVDMLPQCISAMSEPMTSHDNIGFFLLSHEVAKHVKVVLSGQGADELFAGYRCFQQLAQIEKNPFDLKTYRQLVFDHTHEEIRASIMEKWQTADLSGAFILKQFQNNNAEQLVDNALQVDATFSLANGPLARVDNMAMTASIEARVPFLDQDVVNLASAMPRSFKLANNGKSILKKLGLELLPSEVVNRSKGYFPVPTLMSMQKPVLNLMKEVLFSSQCRKRGIFNPAFIKKLLAKHDKYLTPLGASKLWQIGVLEYWFQLQGI